uniref:Uncharacterized protein n=1 Tax=Glossina palpalis gambiensis TaxID=67801 RepID=A0A1B0BZ37_9MUSC
MYSKSELWPMIVILKVGIVGAVLWTVRSLFTRDDIRAPKTKEFNICRKVYIIIDQWLELISRQDLLFLSDVKKIYKRFSVLFLTFNQKYEIPPGLMKAYLGGDDDEEQEE